MVNFKTCFHSRLISMHNNLFHSPLFFNPWILRYAEVNDFTGYSIIIQEKWSFKITRLWSFQHWRLTPKSTQSLGRKLALHSWSTQGWTSMNFLSYHSLIKLLLRFKVRNPGMELNSNGVRIPVDKCGRTPLNYIPCLDKAIKRIKKGSSCYRRILLKQKLPGSKMYRGKLEKKVRHYS